MVYVDGVCALLPRESLDAWPHGAVVPLPKPDITLLERNLRRGLSDVTRLFMHVAHGALRDGGALDTQPRVVFGSAFGEIATAEAMLAQATRDDSASPARFRHSVHNAAEGLYSISRGNTEPATALAAGYDTVAMGLIEAFAQLACADEQVLLVFAEEEVPRTLSEEHPHGALAVAFLLAARPSIHTRAELRSLRRGPPSVLADTFGPELHPLGPALCLARAMEATRGATIVLGDGHAPYCVDVSPRAPS